MSKPIANPPRLSSLSDVEDPLGVGHMFREGRELPEEDLSRLRWRLRTSQRLRAVRPPLLLKVVMVVGIAFLTGGVVGAVVAPFFSPFSARKKAVVVRPPAVGLVPSFEHRRSRAVVFAPTTEVQPGLTPAAIVSTPIVPTPVAPTPVAATPRANEPKLLSALTKPKARPRLALGEEATPSDGAPNVPVEPPPAVFAPIASTIAAEQTLLGQAMRSLRGGQDARTALALLARHDERFPRGAFTSEATQLRIEALLSLGRRDEALAELDAAPLASLPNRDEQRVVRGELRAAHQRWREGAQDFDDVLAESRVPAAGSKLRNLQERALWGRAAARSRLGDQNGARADLERYLYLFPGGRFAGPASVLLKGSP